MAPVRRTGNLPDREEALGIVGWLDDSLHDLMPLGKGLFRAVELARLGGRSELLAGCSLLHPLDPPDTGIFRQVPAVERRRESVGKTGHGSKWGYTVSTICCRLRLRNVVQETANWTFANWSPLPLGEG